MAKTYNRLVIDVNQHINTIGIRPVQGDTKSRYLDVSLYENGAAINLTGEQVRINFEKADGTTFFNQGEITDAEAGRCQFALTNEILSEAKVVKAQISIWNTENEILSTEVFTILVTESIRNDAAVESENEFGVLVVLFQEIQNALDLMQAVLDSFGEPGEKAAEYGVDTFWGILETLAARIDMETVLKKYIVEALNSTLGTDAFLPLDEMITGHGVQEFTSDGTFTVPKGVHKIWVTACGGGGGGEGGTSTTNSYRPGGSGGNGGACIIREAYLVEPEQQIAIKIGAGGSAGKNGKSESTVGGSGSATIIGELVTLAGGSAGVTPGVGAGAGGAGGYYKSGSDDNSYGEDGGSGARGNAGRGSSAYGGAGGGGGSYGNGATIDETPGFGGGGAGGYYDKYAPSAGGEGYCLIEW